MGAPTGPRLEEHHARKEYVCGDPDGIGCARRILRGDRYTQISHAPGAPPFRSPTWVIVRACSTCRELAPSTASPSPCPIGSAGATCLRGAGHLELGLDHEYAIGLF